MLCGNCGFALQGGEDTAIFICPNCGSAHEPGEQGLTRFLPLTAAPTTELAVAGQVRFLAVWRLWVTVSAATDSAWERIRRAAAPRPALLYIPAFSLMRSMVQRLGVGLTEAQPELELDRGLEAGNARRLALVETGANMVVNDRNREQDCSAADVIAEPSFGVFSPVVVGREDARTLGHFVFLAVESHEARDLHAVDYRLETTREELVFIPAVWDPRYIHEFNWRLLLREFDDLVA